MRREVIDPPTPPHTEVLNRDAASTSIPTV